jgi:hypothetical protein
MQAQQAGTKLIEAQIPGAALASAQKAIHVDASGRTWINANGKWMKYSDWEDAGKPSPTGSSLADHYVSQLLQGSVAAQNQPAKKQETQPVAEQTTTTTVPAPQAQTPYDLTDPTKTAPLSAGQRNASNEARTITNQEFGDSREKLIAENQGIQQGARKQVQDAQTIKSSFNQLAVPLATLGAGEEIQPGALAGLQQAAVNTANGVLNRLGLPRFATEGLAASQIADKASEVLAQAKTLNLDQKAISALQRVANSVPNKNMTKEAFADILASSYVDNMRAQHEGTYVMQYGKGQNIPVGRGALEAYRQDHKDIDRQFNLEKVAIKDFLLTQVPDEKTGKSEPLINYMLGYGKNSELAKKITPELINKKYGVNISKYFMN